MSLWDGPVRDVRPLTVDERRSLIAFLDDLTDDEWTTRTAVPGWTVKDIALHLLDDDLGWLSRNRDRDLSGLVDMSDREAFPLLLAAKNERWVAGARGLSRRVVTDLLQWSGDQIDRYHAAADLRGEGWVSWAADGPVPVWFNLAQEFTEQWVHQQQMREAVGRLDDHERRLPDVLRTFVWAFPHQFRAHAQAGSTVEISLGTGDGWTLTADGSGRWALAEGRPTRPAARVTLSAQAAWRLLTGAGVPQDGVQAEGPQEVVDQLMRVRGIIVEIPHGREAGAEPSHGHLT